MKNKDFYTPWGEEYQMNASGLFCGFNMPDALKSDENDSAHKLPPYAKRQSFLVDDYPACPQKWMRCKGKVSSYFVPIQEGKGMWLDFNQNLKHTHEVAIVVSVQGINAITGLPCSDSHLEQYIEKCPKHDEYFGHNRYCEKCGYSWPKQNYISTTGTPGASLWIDGFRASSGAVQQYILTQKESRGVASHIIGDERVFAIGVSFFISKKKKEKPPIGGDILFGSVKKKSHNGTACEENMGFYSPLHIPVDWQIPHNDSGRCVVSSMVTNIDPSVLDEIQWASATPNDSDTVMSSHHAMTVMEPITTKNMEVGAGACICQEIYDDPESLDFWKEDPEAILCINYCLEEEAIEILKQGKKIKQNKAKGFLEEIPVGN